MISIFINPIQACSQTSQDASFMDWVAATFVGDLEFEHGNTRIELKKAPYLWVLISLLNAASLSLIKGKPSPPIIFPEDSRQLKVSSRDDIVEVLYTVLGSDQVDLAIFLGREDIKILLERIQDEFQNVNLSALWHGIPDFWQHGLEGAWYVSDMEIVKDQECYYLRLPS